jgi:ornithine cyclodeaminase/alanine dehydrogenase-like protein (mu-crystallin family)
MPSHTPHLLNIDEAQVRAHLTYADLIPAIRQALRDFSAGRVIQPVRTILSIPPSSISPASGWFGSMPAVYGEVMGAKLVTFYPGNTALHKHTHHAVIQLFRATTGEPIAVLDGRLITEMRTAAVSAVAADLLAPPDAPILAILGSGVQARSHFAALSHVRKFKEVRVWSRNPANAQAFASEIGAPASYVKQATSAEHVITTKQAISAEQAVTEADIVITVTSSPDPILLGRWLKPTALVCAVGSCTPERRELDDDTMRGPIIVESRAAALRESGDIILSQAPIAAELGELLNGTPLAAPPERTTHPTIFKSVGIAIEDIATAHLVYKNFTRSTGCS